MDLEALLSFSPARLQQVRRVVAEAHPTVAQQLAQSLEGTDELRKRVEEASHSLGAVRRLAAELTPRELRLVAHSIGVWSDLREAVAQVVRSRPAPILTAAVWRAWESFPRSELIQRLLGELIEKFGGGAVGGGGGADAVEQWFRDGTPVAAIVSWLAQSGHGRPGPFLNEASPFRAGTTITDYLDQAVLRLGARSQVQRYSVQEVRDLVDRMPPEEQLEALQNYLRRLDPGQWEAPILERIRSDYGMPGIQDSLSRFWRGVSEADQKAFRRHFIAADLAEAFRGDTERHRYWSRWVDEILEVRRGIAGDVPWARMSFNGFAVVEFFQIGNAAYFYPARTVATLDWKRARSPADLKLRLENPVARLGDNRLIHNGRWQPSGDRMMRAWKRAFSR